MNLWGKDFWDARQTELYVARTEQPLWVAALFVLLMFAILTILQSIMGLLAVPFVSETKISLDDPITMQSALAKATIVGLLPSSLLGAFVAWKMATIKNPSSDRGMPFHLPDLGIAGWALTIGGMIAFAWGTLALTFLLLGIDPATYAPSKDGLKDLNSTAGMVEKIMADLSDEPLLFTFALPGVVIAVPIVEEFIFRGPLFSALRFSWFGKVGAVTLSAAAWALVHAFAAPWLFVFVIFMMGLALGWLLLRFGSLTVTIICHACWNLFSSAAIFGGQ